MILKRRKEIIYQKKAGFCTLPVKYKQKNSNQNADPCQKIKGTLEFNFNKDEIIEKIRPLKSGKLASTGITNVMLKCNPEITLPH